MIDVQIAFQGGGAKFIEMLPIVEAFKIAHDEKTINVKRVSGTSAGAICASIIAANIDINKVKSYLISDGEHIVNRLIPNEAKHLLEVIKNNKSDNFLNVKNVYGALIHKNYLNNTIVRGESFFDYTVFKSFIENLMQGNDTPIEELPIPLVITTSNISVQPETN